MGSKGKRKILPRILIQISILSSPPFFHLWKLVIHPFSLLLLYCCLLLWDLLSMPRVVSNSRVGAVKKDESQASINERGEENSGCLLELESLVESSFSLLLLLLLLLLLTTL